MDKKRSLLQAAKLQEPLTFPRCHILDEFLLGWDTPPSLGGTDVPTEGPLLSSTQWNQSFSKVLAPLSCCSVPSVHVITLPAFGASDPDPGQAGME